MTQLPSAGIHYGVSFEDYRSWPAVNISTLKNIRRSALHCKWAMDHPIESDECNVGDAFHVSILEPARFDKEFFLGREEYNAATTEGKAIKAKELEEAAGRTYIRRKAGKDAVDADDVKGMADAVRSFQGARRFLEAPGQCEVSLLWQDPVTGIMCKGRFDKLITGNRPVKLELKTCQNAEEWGFGKQCEKLGYAAQDQFYLWGHKILTGVTPLSVFLAIENKGPWAAALWMLDDASCQTGVIQFRSWLDRYAKCMKDNQWPGYPDKVQTLSLPNYAHTQDNE